MGEVEGRRIIITGANRGIGWALAHEFATAGASLCVHSRTEDGLRRLVDSVTPLASGRVVGVAGDLRDPGLGGRLAEAAGTGLGGLDVLLLNAGVLGPKVLLQDTDWEAFADVMTINVEAQARLFVATLPLLRRSRGAVIWMSTGLGRFALPRFNAYCVSKHALEGLMKLAAVEHGDEGIISVAVAPGMVKTDMLMAAVGAELWETGTTPPQAARGFARLIAQLGPEHNGASLDIAPYLG